MVSICCYAGQKAVKYFTGLVLTLISKLEIVNGEFEFGELETKLIGLFIKQFAL